MDAPVLDTEHAQIVEVQYPVMVDHRGEGFLPVQNHIIALGRFEAQRDGCKCIADVGGPGSHPSQIAFLQFPDPVDSAFFAGGLLIAVIVSELLGEYDNIALHIQWQYYIPVRILREVIMPWKHILS